MNGGGGDGRSAEEVAEQRPDQIRERISTAEKVFEDVLGITEDEPEDVLVVVVVIVDDAAAAVECRREGVRMMVMMAMSVVVVARGCARRPG